MCPACGVWMIEGFVLMGMGLPILGEWMLIMEFRANSRNVGARDGSYGRSLF